MQQQMKQMSLLETPMPAGAVPAWAVLDERQRVELVAVLARLIAKISSEILAAEGGLEYNDE